MSQNCDKHGCMCSVTSVHETDGRVRRSNIKAKWKFNWYTGLMATVLMSVFVVPLFAVVGAWLYISPSWTLISTASGWLLCWTLPRMLRRSLRTTLMGETTRLTTLAMFWLSTATRNTFACLSLCTLGRTLTARRLKRKGWLQGSGPSQGIAKSTQHVNPTEPAAYPSCRYTINWTVWACGWKDCWKVLYLGTTSPAGQKWIRSLLLNERKHVGNGQVLTHL